METNLAPIVLFAFIRLDTLQKTVQALKSNRLSEKSDLFVFIDGPKNEEQKKKQAPLIKYVSDITGFRTINVKHANKNIGLDPSVISGVTDIIDKYGKVIVVEDDIVTTPNFLEFMNQALNSYENNMQVMSISGFGLKVNKPIDYDADVYLFGRSTSWGWATWKNRWETVDWEIKDWEEFKSNRNEIRQFKQRGGSDMFSMLKSCMEGGGMWDIRFCYNMFRQNRYSVVPFLSKVENIGFNELATHCKTVKYNRFRYIMDNELKTTFDMPSDIAPNSIIIKSRLRYQSFSLRLYSKIRNLLNV